MVAHIEIDAHLRLHDEHRALDAEAVHLEARQRGEEDLLLVRVCESAAPVKEPDEVGGGGAHIARAT